MANIDCVLDTSPMAQSIDTVSKHVAATTAAVAAMQTAVIATQKKTSDEICENVDRGFFNLIRSQVSSKKAKYFSEMNASFTLLMQYSRSLSALGNRMEADVARLQRQYYKVFHGLDKSLENRITELDREAMKIGRCRRTLFCDRAIRKIPDTVCSEEDSAGTNGLIQSARLKQRTSGALEAIQNNIQTTQSYKNHVAELMRNETVSAQTEVYLPLICAREESQITPDSVLDVVYFPDCLDTDTRGRMESKVNESLPQLMDAADNTVRSDAVRTAFQKLVAQAGLDERIGQTMMSLFDQGGTE